MGSAKTTAFIREKTLYNTKGYTNTPLLLGHKREVSFDKFNEFLLSLGGYIIKFNPHSRVEMRLDLLIRKPDDFCIQFYIFIFRRELEFQDNLIPQFKFITTEYKCPYGAEV